MKDRKIMVSLAIVTAAFLFLYYSYNIINADVVSFGQNGDGYKNYYTLAYYLRYDSGAHFTGMNYPYGEQVMFTDNQPVMAWILKIIHYVFPGVANHMHGFLAWSIFTSIVLSALILYKTLRKLTVPELHAFVFSILIAMLSPQLQRLHGHFSLGYSCFLPLVIYFLVKLFLGENRLQNFGLLGFTISFFSFIHIYYLAIAGMFILLLAGFYSLTHLKELKSKLGFVVGLIACAIGPFLVVKVFLLFTDHITDRPQAPWGFVETRSTVADIFLHQYSFTGQVATDLFPAARIVYHFEGMGYIGLIATLVIFGALLLIAVRVFEKKVAQPIAFPFNYFLPSAFVLLLFAMAFPFSIDALEKYVYNLPGPLKQFRASGRFNWIFYYTATLFTAVFISQQVKRLEQYRKWISYAVFAFLSFVWLIEVNMISVRHARDFEMMSARVNEPFDEKNLLETLKKAGKKPDDFQAIIAMPFFLNGSEKLYIESESGFDAMKASLFTGLPLVNSQMSRSSESQAYKLANLLSDDLMVKAVLADLPSKKPLLMLAVGGTLSTQEYKLMDRANYLFAQGNCTYFELPLTAFADSSQKARAFIEKTRGKRYKHEDYESDNPIDNVLLKRFESNVLPYAQFGSGAWFNQIGDCFFYLDTLPNAEDNTDYEFSLWFYADNRRPAFPLCYFSEVDTSGHDVIRTDVNGKFSTNTFGKWVRSSIKFKLHDRRNKIYISGYGDYGSYDEIMVRPQNVNVVSAFKSDSNFMFNNFPIR